MALRSAAAPCDTRWLRTDDARLTDHGSLIASLPLVSVWPTLRTVVRGFSIRVWAKRSSPGPRPGASCALFVAKEKSLGTSSFTCTPVPRVAVSICCFCLAVWLDQMQLPRAPTAARGRGL